MEFTKMHGCGNDYVYINGFTQKVPQEEKPALVHRLSDRHFGVGGDGVIFINPSEIADFEMEMYNMDGSRGEMCGNGIRCVGKYVYDHGMTDRTQITVESCGQIKYLTLTVREDKVVTVRVNMGAPVLEAAQIPVSVQSDREESGADRTRSGCGAGAEESGACGIQSGCGGQSGAAESAEAVVNVPIEALGRQLRMTCVSMGNPHAVFFTDDVAGMDLTQIGPALECHPCFPNRTNVEFVRVIDRAHVEMRVWERGTGETLACGTGCCATCVACVLNGLTDERVSVKVLGGEITVEWDRETNLVYMTGPAETVFDGVIDPVI
ncbi:MAG: diaminopimelate epimerase [Eubacteriales bacterium]|nr:diaminopimelate epimerase [Eubacteriales bacterium]